MTKREVISYLVIILVIVLIRSFVVTPVRVKGDSMFDTLHSKDVMILKKYDKSINRFDIVVVDIGSEKVIKRVIGMPGEDIEYKNNKLYINGKVLKDKYGQGKTNDFVDYCQKGYYFVMGDNREVSLDSRSFSCVKKKQILGTTNLTLFPFKRIGIKK